MQIRLHAPRKIVWQLGALVFAAGLIFKAVPVLNVPGEPFFIISTLILLLGTWLF